MSALSEPPHKKSTAGSANATITPASALAANCVQLEGPAIVANANATRDGPATPVSVPTATGLVSHPEETAPCAPGEEHAPVGNANARPTSRGTRGSTARNVRRVRGKGISLGYFV